MTWQILTVPIFKSIYISECLLEPNEVGGNIAQIKNVSVLKNSSLGITGCLILCRGRFVGALEGARRHVEATIEHVRQDPRHRGMVTLREEASDDRSFRDWSLAYAGQSLFIAGIVDRALRGVDEDVGQLMNAIVEFSGGARQ